MAREVRHTRGYLRVDRCAAAGPPTPGRPRERPAGANAAAVGGACLALGQRRPLPSLPRPPRRLPPGHSPGPGPAHSGGLTGQRARRAMARSGGDVRFFLLLLLCSSAAAGYVGLRRAQGTSPSFPPSDTGLAWQPVPGAGRAAHPRRPGVGEHHLQPPQPRATGELGNVCGMSLCGLGSFF